MFCRKCGDTILEDSLFCRKCGTKVEDVQNPETCKSIDVVISDDPKLEEDEIQKLVDTAKNATSSVIEKMPKKITKGGWFAICAAIVVVIFVIYSVSFQNALSEAKSLYSKGEYYKAADKLEGYFGIGNQEVEKIRFADKVGMYYVFYKNDTDTSSSWRTPDYVSALENLIHGLDSCIRYEKDADTDVKKSVLKDFRSKYLSALKYTYDISEPDAIKMTELSYKEIQEKAKSIGSKVSTAKAEEKYNNENPIEFKDISLSESNSSYTVATGTAYNRGSRTVKFVTIKVSFKDSNGKVIDTDSTYAVGSEGLAPGESTKWRASVNRDRSITSVSVSIIKFD